MNKKVIQFPKARTITITTKHKVPSLFIKLAYGLMFKLEILPDISLVAVLGNGNEISNHAALVTWLRKNYSVDQIEAMRSPIEVITNELRTYLNNKLNNMEDSSC